MIKKDLDINFKILVKIENWFVNLLFYFYKAGYRYNVMMKNKRTKVLDQIVGKYYGLKAVVKEYLCEIICNNHGIQSCNCLGIQTCNYHGLQSCSNHGLQTCINLGLQICNNHGLQSCNNHGVQAVVSILGR